MFISGPFSFSADSCNLGKLLYKISCLTPSSREHFAAVNLWLDQITALLDYRHQFQSSVWHCSVDVAQWNRDRGSCFAITCQTLVCFKKGILLTLYRIFTFAVLLAELSHITSLHFTFHCRVKPFEWNKYIRYLSCSLLWFGLAASLRKLAA